MDQITVTVTQTVVRTVTMDAAGWRALLGVRGSTEQVAQYLDLHHPPEAHAALGDLHVTEEWRVE